MNGCQGARVEDGQETEWVPLHVPESSSDRHWSHWPCSSLSQGQYSPSTEGGIRYPHIQQQESHVGINREKREELFSIARQ